MPDSGAQAQGGSCDGRRVRRKEGVTDVNQHVGTIGK